MPDALSYSRLFASKQINNAADDLIFTLSAGVLRNLVILVSNTTAGAVTLDGWVVPTAGSTGASNKFMEDYSISANTPVEIAVPKMVAGDSLYLRASAATSLTVFDHDSVVRV